MYVLLRTGLAKRIKKIEDLRDRFAIGKFHGELTSTYDSLMRGQNQLCDAYSEKVVKGIPRAQEAVLVQQIEDVIAELVWTLTGNIDLALSPKHLLKHLLTAQLVPATTLTSFAAAVVNDAPDLSQALPSTSQANACRNARAFIRRWGMTWKVPIATYMYQLDGKKLEVPYISPLEFVRFLLEKAPECLFGGLHVVEGQKLLKSFWAAYKPTHPGHVVYEEHSECTSRVIPFCVHGDEGRGLKKTNTCILTIESIFGLETGVNVATGTHYNCCRCCSERGVDLTAQCKTEAGPGVEQPWTAFQEVNQRQHSFLTKFLLFALPHSVYKANNLLPSLLQQISLELRQLFYEGVWARGTYWFGTCIGMKGDLAWFAHVGNLKRSYKNLSADTPCCHECLAGTIALPFEDINKEPVWKDSVYTVRPWSSDNPPMFKDIPFDSKQPERILRRDFFHCSKLGTFRDYCGSTVAMLCKLQYFTVAGQPNNMKVLLERAHGHFRLFCATAGLHPALHSFTKDNFNCSSSRKYPWCKTKGSDTMLLLQWLQFLTRSCMNQPREASHVDLLETMNRAACAACAWAKSLYKHGMWLTKQCAAAMYEEGLEFLTCYNALAYECLDSIESLAFCGYAMKPKIHLLCHQLYEQLVWLRDPAVTFIPSPLIYCCEANEDVIGKCSRIMRRVHARRAPKETLLRYLTKARALYKRFIDKKQITSISRKRKRVD
eukprot:s2799_g4.t1